MSRRSQFLPLLLTATAALPCSGWAGNFTYSPFTGDADSGINSGLAYTAKADFLGTGSRTINGVLFTDTGTTGGNYVLSNTSGTFAGFGNTVTGVSGGLVSDFFHTGDGSGNASVTLTGLTPGASYITSWHNVGFGAAGGRVVNITPSDTGTPFSFDANYTGNGNGNVLRYAFTATGTSITYAFDAVSNGDSFHHYGLTNSLANTGLLTTPTITFVSGAGPFSPYSPSSSDLLQTSLGSVTSSGNFSLEGTGGVPILNNGQFSITGVGGSNPQLATVENNSLVTFTLDTTAAPLGYDVSGIDTYGGWNDAGRDRQLYKISYSLVGSSDFTFIGAMDYNPAAGAIPSAVKASFPTSLTGVDALRFEFFGSQENNYAGMGEIDVFGAATVPEPVTSVFLLIGGGLFLRRRPGIRR